MLGPGAFHTTGHDLDSLLDLPPQENHALGQNFSSSSSLNMPNLISPTSSPHSMRSRFQPPQAFVKKPQQLHPSASDHPRHFQIPSRLHPSSLQQLLRSEQSQSSRQPQQTLPSVPGATSASLFPSISHSSPLQPPAGSQTVLFSTPNVSSFEDPTLYSDYYSFTTGSSDPSTSSSNAPSSPLSSIPTHLSAGTSNQPQTSPPNLILPSIQLITSTTSSSNTSPSPDPSSPNQQAAPTSLSGGLASRSSATITDSSIVPPKESKSSTRPNDDIPASNVVSNYRPYPVSHDPDLRPSKRRKRQPSKRYNNSDTIVYSIKEAALASAASQPVNLFPPLDETDGVIEHVEHNFLSTNRAVSHVSSGDVGQGVSHEGGSGIDFSNAASSQATHFLPQASDLGKSGSSITADQRVTANDFSVGDGDAPSMPRRQRKSKPKKQRIACQYCDKTFTLSPNLKRHIMNIHQAPGMNLFLFSMRNNPFPFPQYRFRCSSLFV